MALLGLLTKGAKMAYKAAKKSKKAKKAKKKKKDPNRPIRVKNMEQARRAAIRMKRLQDQRPVSKGEAAAAGGAGLAAVLATKMRAKKRVTQTAPKLSAGRPGPMQRGTM